MRSSGTQKALLLCGLLLALPCAQAKKPDDERSSRPDRGYYEQRPAQDQSPRPAPRGMSLSDAVSEAERRTGGRVLSADPREDNGQIYYRVKVLTPNGRVQMLHIDAR